MNGCDAQEAPRRSKVKVLHDETEDYRDRKPFLCCTTTYATVLKPKSVVILVERVRNDVNRTKEHSRVTQVEHWLNREREREELTF